MQPEERKQDAGAHHVPGARLCRPLWRTARLLACIQVRAILSDLIGGLCVRCHCIHQVSRSSTIGLELGCRLEAEMDTGRLATRSNGGAAPMLELPQKGKRKRAPVPASAQPSTSRHAGAHAAGSAAGSAQAPSAKLPRITLPKPRARKKAKAQAQVPGMAAGSTASIDSASAAAPVPAPLHSAAPAGRAPAAAAAVRAPSPAAHIGPHADPGSDSDDLSVSGASEHSVDGDYTLPRRSGAGVPKHVVNPADASAGESSDAEPLAAKLQRQRRAHTGQDTAEHDAAHARPPVAPAAAGSPAPTAAQAKARAKASQPLQRARLGSASVERSHEASGSAGVDSEAGMGRQGRGDGALSRPSDLGAATCFASQLDSVTAFPGGCTFEIEIEIDETR